MYHQTLSQVFMEKKTSAEYALKKFKEKYNYDPDAKTITVNGVDFQESVRQASRFVKKCIMKSIEMDLPLTDGVCFEELLATLK